MRKFDLSVYAFTNIDKQNLQAEVRRVSDEFPRVGEIMVKQILH